MRRRRLIQGGITTTWTNETVEACNLFSASVFGPVGCLFLPCLLPTTRGPIVGCFMDGPKGGDKLRLGSSRFASPRWTLGRYSGAGLRF